MRRCFDAREESGAILCINKRTRFWKAERGATVTIGMQHRDQLSPSTNEAIEAAILTTNMESAIDMAFMRRLRFIVRFLPGVAERKLMWKNAFPSGALVDQLDYDRLARFTLTG